MKEDSNWKSEHSGSCGMSGKQMLSVVNHNLRNYLEQIATFLFVFNNRTVPREGEDITIIYPYPVFKLTMPLPLYLGDKLKQAIKSCFMFPRKQMLGGGGAREGRGVSHFIWRECLFPYLFILILTFSSSLSFSLLMLQNKPPQTVVQNHHFILLTCSGAPEFRGSTVEMAGLYNV